MELKVQQEYQAPKGWALRWQWEPGPRLKVQSPSNLALIKYMGKLAPGVATNPSVSVTLPHLVTEVSIGPATKPNLEIPQLEPGTAGFERFAKAVEYLKQAWNILEPLEIQSRNNFPQSAGLASSSSAFSALTMALWLWARQASNQSRITSKLPSWSQLPALSATLSGASGRSFYGPACLWWKSQFIPLIFEPCYQGYHAVFGVEINPKAVSSSQAHARVVTSLLFQDRARRARRRLRQVLNHRFEKSINFDLFQIVWHEFWDMHALFETSQEAFGYLLPLTLEIINFWRQFWKKHGWGPLVTLDAGANVHVLFDRYKAQEAQKIVRQQAEVWGVSCWDGFLSYREGGGPFVMSSPDSLDASYGLTINAKVILVGEHAVMQGVPAWVWPVSGVFFRCQGTWGQPSQPLIWDVPGDESALIFDFLSSLMRRFRLSYPWPRGRFGLDGVFLWGSGFGTSALMAVFWAHWWLTHLGVLPLNSKNQSSHPLGVEVPFFLDGSGSRVFDLNLRNPFEVLKNHDPWQALWSWAKPVEDFLHGGHSSGVDVAAVLAQVPIGFRVCQQKAFCEPLAGFDSWFQGIRVIHTGTRADTAQAIRKVKSLPESRFKAGLQAMVEAVDHFEKFLSNQKFHELVASFQKAHAAFETWQLLWPAYWKVREKLLNLKALAIKPTGSGLGGAVLALWDRPPLDAELEKLGLPIFRLMTPFQSTL